MAETLVALVLSSFVIVLASHSFLVQSRFYATQTLRTAAQEIARTTTELMSREIRAALDGGILVAGPRTLTVRSLIAVVVVCNRTGVPNLDVYNEGGEAALDTEEVAGLARRDPVSGSWEAVNDSWAALDGTTPDPAGNCADNGADTVGVSSYFHRLSVSPFSFSTNPEEGDLLALFRETTFKIQPSELEPGSLGIFRAALGGSMVEFASGLDDTALFRYRTAGGPYADTVSSGSVADIDAVQIGAYIRKPAPTGGVEDVTFGWAVTVPLRNVR